MINFISDHSNFAKYNIFNRVGLVQV